MSDQAPAAPSGANLSGLKAMLDATKGANLAGMKAMLDATKGANLAGMKAMMDASRAMAPVHDLFANPRETCKVKVRGGKECGRTFETSRFALGMPQERGCIFHRESKNAQEFLEEFQELLETVMAGGDHELDCTRFIFPPIALENDLAIPVPAYFDRCLFGSVSLRLRFGKAVEITRSAAEELDVSGSTFADSLKISQLRAKDGLLNLSNSAFAKDVLIEASEVHLLDLGTVKGQAMRLSNLTCDELHVTSSTIADLSLHVVESQQLHVKNATLTKCTAHQLKIYDLTDCSGSAMGVARFTESSFGAIARFTDTTLGWGTSFDGCRFDGDAFFRNLRAEGDSTNEALPWVSFRFVAIAGTDTVEFSSTTAVPLDVSRISWTFTDVAKIRFQNVTWLQAPSRLNWIQRKRGAIIPRAFDEDLVSPPPGTIAKPIDAEYVRDVYKGLRRSYERALKYSEAGAFHIREMEMKYFGGRPSMWKRVGRHFTALGLYRFVSWYGESYRRAFWVLFGWVSLVALLNILVYPHWPWTGSIWAGVLAGVNSVTLGQAASTVRQFLERIIGLGIVTLLVLALRRNFKR